VDGVTASGTLQVEVFSRFFISLVPTAFGVAGNGLSQNPAVSADGGVVAFESASSDLVPGDTLGLLDIFVEQSGTIERVSLAFDGSEPDFECIKPDISAAGTRVIFQTESALSDPGIDLDDNGESDIYLVDRTGPSIERVSLSALGGQLGVGATEGAISANGQFVTFSSGERLLPLTPGVGPLQVYRKNLTTGAVDLVSGFEITPGVTLPADFDCTQSAVSADGRFVVFVSASTVFDSLTNPNGDVFIKDMNTPLAAPVRVSLPGSGIPTGQISRFPSVSADGNFVAFESFGSFVAADLDGSSDIYVWNRVADTFVQASVTSTGAQVTGDSAWASLSGDGRFVAFSCLDDLTPDAGPEEDVYVRDLSGTADAIQLASKSPAGAPGDEVSSGPLDLSDDGNHVVFQSLASNLGQLGNVSGDLFKATNPVLFPVLP
jgi:Tol biopolymer transport system component